MIPKGSVPPIDGECAHVPERRERRADEAHRRLVEATVGVREPARAMFKRERVQRLMRGEQLRTKSCRSRARE